jgi:hypothetical protein
VKFEPQNSGVETLPQELNKIWKEGFDFKWLRNSLVRRRSPHTVGTSLRVVRKLEVKFQLRATATEQMLSHVSESVCEVDAKFGINYEVIFSTPAGGAYPHVGMACFDSCRFASFAARDDCGATTGPGNRTPFRQISQLR